MKKGNLIVISGPSGAGKGTICKELLKREDNLYISVSATTRSPREGEVHGVNYYFLTKEEFKKKVEKLKILKESGLLSEEEFKAEQAKLLNQI